MKPATDNNIHIKENITVFAPTFLLTQSFRLNQESELKDGVRLCKLVRLIAPGKWVVMVISWFVRFEASVMLITTHPPPPTIRLCARREGGRSTRGLQVPTKD